MKSTFGKLLIVYVLWKIAVIVLNLRDERTPFTEHPYLYLFNIIAILLIALNEIRKGTIRKKFKRFRAQIAIQGNKYDLNKNADLSKITWPLKTLHKRFVVEAVGILLPLLRVIGNPIKYTNRLTKLFPLLRSSTIIYVVIFFLVYYFYKAIFNPQEIPIGAGEAFNSIIDLFVIGLFVFLIFKEYIRGYIGMLRYIENENHWRDVRRKREIALEQQGIAEKKEKEIAIRHKKEIEEIMAMFAHKFRGPLDSVIYNSEHSNNKQLYREAVRTMNGLLEIFSLISTDSNLLLAKLRADTNGTVSVSEIAARSLRSALAQLLSQRGSERIQQHLLAFAQHNNLISIDVTPKIWEQEHQQIASSIRSDWETSLMTLPAEANLENLSAWMNDRFFPIIFDGFDDIALRCAPYGTRASLLTILFTEIFTNMLKYYASDNSAIAQVSWGSEESFLVACANNPTRRSMRLAIKGSGRGHQFLKLITEKIEGSVQTGFAGDNFTISLKIPLSLFLEIE